MTITSKKTHTITFPYYDNDGILRKVKIEPGKNEVDSKGWEVVKKNYSPLYFKGLKIN